MRLLNRPLVTIIIMFSRKKNKLGEHHFKQLARDIDPDEIFLDASNLPEFDKHQFEGRIEAPIGKSAIWSVVLVFLLVEIIFIGKVFSLQVVHGGELLAKSENNRLEHTPIFATRGVVYDRRETLLAWNSFSSSTPVSLFATTTTKELLFPRRSYIDLPGFSHVLGYLSYPKMDSNGFYYQKLFIGKDGIEESYNDVLEGENGLRIVETDALGKVAPGSIIEEPKNGKDLTLSVDARVQTKLFTTIRSLAEDQNYMAGAGVIMDVSSGEILALTSYPEFDSSVLSDGSDRKLIQSYQTDKRSVFLDRTVSGVYTPGSILKPIMAAAALAEGVILPTKEILSTGSISIQNPYDPNLKSVFNDWKAHGLVDMRRAIAVSSDVYFYEIGGGFESQKGIGIINIEKYARMFGLGVPTGIDLMGEKSGTIPSPTWKAATLGEPWRLGDTYNTVIGQYGFQVTPLQAARATASIANDGTLVTPHLVKGLPQAVNVLKIPIASEHLSVAREGMRDAVQYGTVIGLNVGYVTVGGKTGTAELDSRKKFINSWVVGFFPYEKPRYAFAVVMERGPYSNDIGGVYVMRQMLDWMWQNAPEYLL
ncbi:MAG: Cell division protein ftsi/penicillin-binding protein 2 [Parcubacteria group bacterium GW2011_GWA1_47_8]|nr:MAG: Cell division protein ftsi/penicillin-binding protein 2 [Parcubacteria group bacterium GW2011_GWA1_47_8]